MKQYVVMFYYNLAQMSNVSLTVSGYVEYKYFMSENLAVAPFSNMV